MRSFFRLVGAGVARLSLVAATALCLFSQSATAVAQPAAAGTIIRNIAQVTYFDTDLGILVTVESNAVEASVSMVPAVEVTGRNQLFLSRGAIDQFQFEVSNVGNVAVDVTPALQITGNTGQLLNLQLFIDRNANGIAEADEAAAIGIDSFEVPTGGRSQLIYTFQVASTAQFGDTYNVELTASADPVILDEVYIGSDETVTGLGTGTVEIISSTLEIEKSQAVQPGADATRVLYDLRFAQQFRRGGCRLRADRRHGVAHRRCGGDGCSAARRNPAECPL